MTHPQRSRDGNVGMFLGSRILQTSSKNEKRVLLDQTQMRFFEVWGLKRGVFFDFTRNPRLGIFYIYINIPIICQIGLCAYER